MQFEETSLKGAYLIIPDPHIDERGLFARTWCQKEFKQHNLNPNIVQCNTSWNSNLGTLRGMHFQKSPNQEAKVVRCTSGSIFDVIIDLREDSPTYKQWEGFELDALNRNGLYIPEGLAHGFITLKDNSEVFYQMSHFYHPDSSAGVRWNDPAFEVSWPIEPLVISDKDADYPDLPPVFASPARWPFSSKTW